MSPRRFSRKDNEPLKAIGPSEVSNPFQCVIREAGQRVSNPTRHPQQAILGQDALSEGPIVVSSRNSRMRLTWPLKCPAQECAGRSQDKAGTFESSSVRRVTLSFL